MAEARHEEEELRDMRNRNQAADRSERNKPEHFHASQGPLSSIRAAIKRTRSNSQSDHARDRSRPEITILSAEPLTSSAWFPRPSGRFSPVSPTAQIWAGSIQTSPQPPPSYDQVIKEKTQEHVATPTAAPRRSSTIATQTDPVEEDAPAVSGPGCTAAAQPIERASSVKKPKKPQRPSLPKPLHITRISGTVGSGHTQADQTTSINTLNQSEIKSSVAQSSPPDTSCKIPQKSVRVYFSDSVSTTPDSPATLASTEHTPTQRPTPLPRLKSRKQPIPEEVKVQTLVRLSDNGESPQVTPVANPEEGYLKYLQELLDVFPGDDQCDRGFDVGNQSDGSPPSEDDDMSAIHSRIQAFESRASIDKEEEVLKCPKPQPRNTHLKPPPVAAKPALAPRPSISDTRSTANSYQDAANSSILPRPNPIPSPKPQLPRKPSVDPAAKEEADTLPAKKAILPPPQSSLAARAKAFLPQEEVSALVPPTPPEKPRVELFNLNNHNSTSLADNEYSDSPSIPVKPLRTEASFTRQSITRRPTTIRVPSKASLRYESSDDPPPLPAQKPVGSLPPPPTHRQSFTPSLRSQDSFNSEPSLPPQPTGGKVLPPRPPPAKAAPGRPPPPRLNGSGRPASTYGTPSPKQPPAQKPRRKGPVLPPRPRPGHRLYNKYTLELPHGIAQFDYNGSNAEELSFQKDEVLLLLEQVDSQTFVCQIGEAKGRVQKSHMKVITPLSSSAASQHTQQGVGPVGSGLQVQALHDFTPEGPGELCLRVGDVVTMVEQVDSEWYRGTNRGSTGFFPANYVTVLSNASTPTSGKKATPPGATVSGPRCVARFDFEAEQSNELSFSEGEVIKLLEYVGQAWARGRVRSCTGIFPLNFVEVIEDLPPPPATQQPSAPTKIAMPGMVALPKTQEAVKPIQSSPGAAWAVALYDFAGETEEDLSFQQGDRILVTQHIDADWCSGRLNGQQGVFPRAFIETSSSGCSSAMDKQCDTTGRRAKALFDFPSDCEEELSLQVGDVITNLESIDDEWFLGDLKGKRALVPKNYVQVLAEP